MIVCAAIKDSRNGNVIGGVRHSYILNTIKDLNIQIPKENRIQGFLTDDNKFVDRVEAYHIAFACGQLSSSIKNIKYKNKENELFSEDIY